MSMSGRWPVTAVNPTGLLPKIGDCQIIGKQIGLKIGVRDDKFGTRRTGRRGYQQVSHRHLFAVGPKFVLNTRRFRGAVSLKSIDCTPPIDCRAT
jgi:hypothetical protein